MDMKIQGISFEILEEALQQAKRGRLHILEKMAETISSARTTISEFAPQFVNMTIDGDSIGAVIGPGGKVIQTLQKETDTEIWIEEDDNGKGQITISADSLEKAEAAKKRIQAIAGHLDEGATYNGTVKAIKEYGAFVEIVPGKEGLLHISELTHGHVKRVEDILAVGEQVDVKLLKVEHGGKLRLSRKALLPEEQEAGKRIVSRPIFSKRPCTLQGLFFCPDERSFSILNRYSFGIRTCRLNVSHALYFRKVISLPFTDPKGFGQETCMAFGEEYPAFSDAPSDYRNGLPEVSCSKSAARRCLSALSGCPWLGTLLC